MIFIRCVYLKINGTFIVHTHIINIYHQHAGNIGAYFHVYIFAKPVWLAFQNELVSQVYIHRDDSRHGPKQKQQNLESEFWAKVLKFRVQISGAIYLN